MAKLQDCQFIKVKIDGKELKGASEEDTYKDWMEGYAPVNLQAYSGICLLYTSPSPRDA